MRRTDFLRADQSADRSDFYHYRRRLSAGFAVFDIPAGSAVLLFVVYLAGRTESKKLIRREVIFFLLYIFIPLGAGASQMFLRGIAVVNVGVTLALLFIFVNIQSERDLLIRQQEKELAESRVEIMLSQIQPHFLYNTLTTICQLCDVDPHQAKAAIRDFSLFLRGNMDSLESKAPIPFESGASPCGKLSVTGTSALSEPA